ncbi:class I SAM-dependent methyltransferase [Mycobacterium sp. CVI_P3]|uniref:Class I SAM-dependent methyltransferase n=1 Tax=Mycobacterium pinniadriaticum TaxID=2994102 RepID=A0ABT3SMH8_9MYCO|nr:class I SAM-dependent methyltransferase [Mycobacterium pinniadriaticum]MCX2934306.1 class I SAM-dependent methyltransferase [Mycobacterium pinniadriaticum]MCX2940729.1 class I SAM-dependent methyltransferase [Mycobacterium pinniadriaticum]
MTQIHLPTTQPAARAGVGDIAARYDAAPYLNASYPKTQPARLAAIATMLGLRPPPVPSARVLELGCACGGNIIPLAARYPDMRCVGVDLSGVQIARGQVRLQQAGLTNVELHQQDITEIGAEYGQFDYIICHGVYSWVPEHVREAVLRVISALLAYDGVAVVSYNVLPGWHAKLAVRESLLAHTADLADPAEIVAEARRLMSLLKESGQQTPYGLALRFEAELMEVAPDDYILHDLLEPDNEPCTVTEFVQAARRHGLGYLAESDIHTMLNEFYGAAMAQTLRELSGGLLLQTERYIDIVTGRTLRQSVLVKQDQVRTANYSLGPECLADLHLSGRYELDPERDADGAFVFRTPAGRTVTSTSASVAAALQTLSQRYPATAGPAELMAAAAAGPEPAVTEDVLLDVLFRMLSNNMIDIFSEPIRVGTPDAELPAAPALTRLDAQSGASLTTNLRHEPVGIEPIDRLLLAQLDGSHDRAALCEVVLSAVRSGSIAIQRGEQAVVDEDERRRGAMATVAMILRALASRALLEP